MTENYLDKQGSYSDLSSPEKIFTAYKHLELALSHYRLGYYDLDLATGLINCSAACKANYGLGPDAVLNRREVFNAILPEYHGYIEAQLEKAFQNHSEYEAEYEIYWPDRSVHWIKATGFPVYNESDEPVRLVGITVNITDVKKAEEKQAMLAAIIDTSDDTILSKTLDGTITSWNKSAEKMFGYTAKEVVGKHISLLIPKERLHEEEIILANIGAGKKVDHFVTERLRKDGSIVPISLSVSPIKNSQGKVIGASKIARDITVQKLADERKAILAAIVDTSEDAIVSKTLDGIITSWNKGAERIFGFTEDEVLGNHISIIIPPSRLNEEDLIIGNISRGKRVQHFETYRLTKKGIEIPVSLSVSPIMDADGDIIGASKIARDISEQVRDKYLLRRQNESLQILNSIGKTISQKLDINVILQNVTDETTKLTGANFGAFFYNTVGPEGEAFMLYTLSGAPREAFEKFGMPRNTAVFHTTFSGEGISRVDDITKDPRYGKNSPHNGMPKGHLPVVSYLAVPVISSSGIVIGGLFFGHREAGKFTQEHEELVAGVASQTAIAIDNAKLYLEVQELNKKKDEFIGLASHELKTPLTSISGYLQLLERNQTTEANKKFVSKTVEQVKKLNALVGDLLDVSKIESGKLQLTKTGFSMKALILDVIELISFTKSKHQIVFESNTADGFIFADQPRLEQALINLLTNAIKYSPGADRVIVSLKDSADAISVSIRDFGIGIAPGKQQHIFSRFYRVEELSPHMSGLGLGLYITREIIQRHKGTLTVESEPEKGSLFTLTLPKKK